MIIMVNEHNAPEVYMVFPSKNDTVETKKYLAMTLKMDQRDLLLESELGLDSFDESDDFFLYDSEPDLEFINSIAPIIKNELNRAAVVEKEIAAVSVLREQENLFYIQKNTKSSDEEKPTLQQETTNEKVASFDAYYEKKKKKERYQSAQKIFGTIFNEFD